jgi:predicted Zn-dependent protease
VLARVDQQDFDWMPNFKTNKLLTLVTKGQLAIFIAAMWVGLPLPLGAQSTAPVASSALPQLGDGGDITSGAERRLGDRIARELYQDPDFIDDPVLVDYVQCIWQPLLASSRLRGDLTPELDDHFAWRILLGKDRSVNAFALPGGYMGLHLGLMAVVSSKDELASVLGHELSHITQRHIPRLMAKNSQQTPWMIGAMILGALAASKNPDAGSALMVGGQAVSAQSQLNFSRDMEREADRMGFAVMTQAGFDAKGFVSMFDKLQQASRLNDSGAYPYLRTHPLTTERIADMQARMPLDTPHNLDITPTMAHAMLTARARVLSNPGVDALRTWQDQAQDAGLSKKALAVQVGVWYGAALAAIELHDFSLARRDLVQLDKLSKDDADAAQQARWLTVEIALAARDLSPAKLLDLGPLVGMDQNTASAIRRPELLLQAQIALQTGHAPTLSAVAQKLQTWVANDPNDALAWQWLASITAAQNEPLRSLRAEAESRMAHLDYQGAMDRLKSAQDRMRVTKSNPSSADHIDASIIDARRRQIDALIKEQAKERQ